MKWFQVDADTPSDPKIVAVKEAFGTEGIGALFLIWCYVADHGIEPGRSIDSHKKPFPLSSIQVSSGLKPDKFEQLVKLCVTIGHFDETAWKSRKEIKIPAMCRRADTYTKRTIRRK